MEVVSLLTGFVGLVIAVFICLYAWKKAQTQGVQPLTVVLGLVAVVVVFIGFSIGSSFGQVDSGHVGLQRSFGGFTGKVFQPGLYSTTPVVTSVDIVDVQNQHQNVDTTILTTDNQNVPMHVSINYNLSQNPADIIATLTANSDDYWTRAIESNFIAATKQIASQSTLTYLNQHLDVISNKILADTVRRVNQVKGTQAIQITQVSIKGIDLSDSYKDAISQKVVAQVAAQTAQINQQKVQFETNQKVIQARGQAEAQKYQGRTITDEYLKLRNIENQEKFIAAWDGHCSALGGCPFSNASGQSGNGTSHYGNVIVDARTLADAVALQAKSDSASDQASPSPQASPSDNDSPDPQPSH